MKRLLTFFILLTVMLTACASKQAAASIGGLEIYNPTIMAGETGQTTGGFLTIKNNGAQAEHLLGVSCDAATMSQIHETTMDGEVMKMREVKAVEISAGGVTKLEHGGYHIMLMDLKQEVKAGNTTTCTLAFEKAGEVAVEFEVVSR